MPILILLLLAVLIWMALTYGRRVATKDCAWRENHSKDNDKGRYYLCVYCGAVRYETNGAPKVCHKPPELR
ncbi:MAG: hypothetical protein AAGF71_11800 [Pseudomonadota bacterium]